MKPSSSTAKVSFTSSPRGWLAPLLVAVFLSAVASGARADMLLPGGTIPTPGTTTAPQGSLLASMAFTYNVTDVDDNTTATGSVRVGVIREASNTLDFIFQISGDVGSAPIASALTYNYSRFTTDVDFLANGAVYGNGFVNGTVATATANRDTSGDVTFNLAGQGIGAGQVSNVFFIKTNAIDYKATSPFLVIDDQGNSDGPQTFGPTGVAVPEPTSLATLAVGGVLVLAGYFGRRRISRR